MASRLTQPIRIEGAALERFANYLAQALPMAEYVLGIRDTLGIPDVARYRLVLEGAIVLIPDPPVEYAVPDHPDPPAGNGRRAHNGARLTSTEPTATGGD